MHNSLCNRCAREDISYFIYWRRYYVEKAYSLYIIGLDPLFRQSTYSYCGVCAFVMLQYSFIKWYLCLHSCGQSITLCKHWIRSMTWQYINLHNSLSIAFFSTKYMLSRESLIIKCYNQHIYVICEALNFYLTTHINATSDNNFLTWKWHF